MPNIIETTDAAASTATAYTLQVGQTAQGQLTTGDHDWYAVNLTAGQTYAFAMTGTGSANVTDTFLRLYASNGTTLLVSNDDGLPNLNSVFTYTATTTGTYYIDAAAYSASDVGQYGVAVTAGTRVSLDTQMGAGVIDADASWSATPGTAATVTYGFRQTSNGEQATFAQATAAQIVAVEAILQIYSEICNVTFTRVNPGGTTDSATILVADYNASDGAGAYAYYPGSTAASSVAGDVWLNSSVSLSSLPVGGYSYFAIMHEFGHALGLSHPGLYNAGVGVSITYAANAQFTQDTHQYSIMSYFDEQYTTGSYGSYPDTPMLFDIAALQGIYGANTATRAGDTVYGFHATLTGSIYDFNTNPVPALCIWDGGGTDTLDLSGYGAAQVIRLSAGAFSDVGGLTGNVSIALGATIENAVGGSGNDAVYLTSAALNNQIDGGGGSDTVYVTYNFGSGYTTSGTASNLVITGGAGTDTLQNVEFVSFADGTTVATSSLVSAAVAGSVVISDVVVTEGSAGTQFVVFTVTRSGGTAAFSVDFATSDGSAAAGGDYLANSGTVTFAANQTTATIAVVINGDTTYEANETFNVTLSAATNGATIADSLGVGTITNDDAVPVASIAVAPASVAEDGAAVLVYTVTLDHASAFATTVAYTLGGTATAGTDYAALTGSLVIAAGQTSGTITGTLKWFLEAGMISRLQTAMPSESTDVMTMVALPS